MTFTHDDIKNNLLEFLYGELEEEARVAFDTHVAACPSCRADVTALQETRQVARAAVRAGLAEPVPTGVRARVLEAAAAANVAKEAAVAGGQPVAAATAVAKKLGRTEEAGGPFAWLRARWAIPMFATVAAMGVLLLVRETVFREARHPLGETAPGQSAPAVPPGAPAAPTTGTSPTTPAAEAERTEGAREDKKSGGAPADWPDRLAGPEVRRPKRSAAVVSAKPASKAVAKPRPSSNEASGSLDDLLSDRGPGVGSIGSAGAGATKSKREPSAKPQAERSDDLLSGLGRSHPAKKDIAELEAPRVRQLPGSRDGEWKPEGNAGRGFAQPPPSAVSAAPAAAPAAAPKRARSKAEAPAEERAADFEAPAPASAHVASASAAEESDREAPPDPAAPLAARAEKLMTSRQWSEAVTAYRQLIARYPKHEQVPNWKRRLAVVEAAAAKGAPATAPAPSGTGFATPPPAR